MSDLKQQQEDALLRQLKQCVAQVAVKQSALASARQLVAEAELLLSEANAAREEAHRNYTRALYGHAVEVKVSQPADCEDDCG